MADKPNGNEMILSVLDNILEAMHNGVFITDGLGNILRVSSTCKDIFGTDPDLSEGINMALLEEKGVFKPSVTLRVLKERKKVALMQPDKNGQQLLVTGVPIFNSENEIIFVISYVSWDIGSIAELQKQYNDLQQDMIRYSLELEQLRKKEIYVDFIAVSHKMQQVKQLIQKVANTDISVMITGENGAGKNSVAKYLHRYSGRGSGPLIQMSCSAFPVHVLEDELFGYVKLNQASGTEHEKIGLCELANNGTLLLEDVEYLSIDAQGKLLYLLQNKCFFKHGSQETKNTDIRLIVTTKMNIHELVKKNMFREELFYRLNVAPIHVPSLKERKEDILILIQSFLSEFNHKYKKQKRLSQQASDLLLTYTWPGNVRELKYVIERLILTTEADVIHGFNLPGEISPFASTNYDAEVNLNEYLDYHEGRLVLQAFEKCNTTVGVGRFLGISQASAVRKLQKYIPNYTEGKKLSKNE
ncbi:MAG: sigma 54-interacting transcriptional regulator [Clostridia bacterium]